MRLFISFVVGLVFGIGLYVSGMTQPSKVQGFLDIFGHWDAPLVVGSLIFGVGWGLSGICPGPGIVDVGFFNLSALVFVVSMAAGMVIERLVVTVPAAKPAAKPPVGQDA
jgi:uncharacterized membrane protein YedE/YeeE